MCDAHRPAVIAILCYGTTAVNSCTLGAPAPLFLRMDTTPPAAVTRKDSTELNTLTASVPNARTIARCTPVSSSAAEVVS